MERSTFRTDWADRVAKFRAEIEAAIAADGFWPARGLTLSAKIHDGRATEVSLRTTAWPEPASVNLLSVFTAAVDALLKESTVRFGRIEVTAHLGLIRSIEISPRFVFAPLLAAREDEALGKLLA
jgi:hypothetical protein